MRRVKAWIHGDWVETEIGEEDGPQFQIDEDVRCNPDIARREIALIVNDEMRTDARPEDVELIEE